MGKRMRLYATSERVVPYAELSELLDEAGLELSFKAQGDTGDGWRQLDLSHPDGSGIAVIERHPIPDRAEAVREVGECLGVYTGEVQRPAAGWILKQAEAVRALYLVRVHTVFAEDPDGAESIDLILNHLQATLGGLIQADYEGFYVRAADPERNDAAERLLARLRAELGELPPAAVDELFDRDVTDWQITWDPDMDRLRVTGPRQMAVLDGEEWVLFVMDAGDPAHREAFLQGRVPVGVIPKGRRTLRGS
jgi:hypothetical protein